MNRKNLCILLFLSIAVFLSAGGQHESMGDNTYNYDLEDFTEIHGSGSFCIEIQKGDDFSVMIIAEKSLKNKLVVETRGDVLYLGLKPFSGFIGKSPKAIITMPELESIKLSGASELLAAGFISNDDFYCDLSGASSASIDIIAKEMFFDISGASHLYGVLETEEIEMELSGSSKIELYGGADFIKIDAGGASIGNLRDFAIDDADLELSGSSIFYVNINGNLDIDASGASILYYTGNVILGDIELSGSSSIKEE